MTSDDKSALKKAEKALKDALEDFGGNYTPEESDLLNEKLNTVKEALNAIGNAEKAAEEIKTLPSAEEVKTSDKDEVERVKKLLDSLTDSERSMLDRETLDRVTALEDKIRQLEESALRTGDESQIALWLTLLCLSGGMTAGAAILGSRKKREE